MVAQDRRVRKTRAVLKQSLIALMKEKSINHITVKELCEKSDINRGTFYLHYRDVFDLFEQVEMEFFNNLKEVLDESKKDIVSLKDTHLEPMFRFILDNNAFFLVMLSEHGDLSVTRQLFKYIYDRVIQIYGKESAMVEHCYFFIVYGCVGLILNWLNTGAKESPATMASLAENIILNGIAKYL